MKQSTFQTVVGNSLGSYFHITYLITKILCLFFCIFLIDIYVAVLSYQNMVAAKDYYLGFVSTTVSLDSKNPEAELKQGLDLLQPIEKKFVSVKDVYHPKDDGKESQVCHYGIKMTMLTNNLT